MANGNNKCAPPMTTIILSGDTKRVSVLFILKKSKTKKSDTFDVGFVCVWVLASNAGDAQSSTIKYRTWSEFHLNIVANCLIYLREYEIFRKTRIQRWFDDFNWKSSWIFVFEGDLNSVGINLTSENMDWLQFQFFK